MKERNSPKISFFSKNKMTCPVCKAQFYREDLLTGRGRLNAVNLTDELHRQYLSQKSSYPIQPLRYSVWTCPHCYYSTLKEDFFKPTKPMTKDLGKPSQITMRQEAAASAAHDLNFAAPRRLQEGVASYISALYTYQYFPKDKAPVLKQAICAVRGAWLAVDLHRENPDEHYDYLARILYRKAGFLYQRALELDESGEQPLNHDSISNWGPDIDYNFGIDGATYLYSILYFKYGQSTNFPKRIERLKDARIRLARLVGMDNVSKGKPSAILKPGRQLYELISREIKRLEQAPPTASQGSP